MLSRKLVTRDDLVAALALAEQELHRYPAVDGSSWRVAVEAVEEQS